jgi:hypothetical protein
MLAGFHLQDKKLIRFGSDKAYESLGCRIIDTFEIGNLSLRLYSKAYVKNKYFVEYKDRKITCIGLFFYKNACLEKALTLYLKDYLTGSIDWNSLSGTFAILIWNEFEIEIILDSFVVQSVFINLNNKVISSSFLGILDNDFQFTINKDAALEVLLTGNLVGPDTLINEIQRVDKFCYIDIFNNLRISCASEPTNIKRPRSRDEAISLTLNCLRKTMCNIEGILKDNGLITGITGGLDSRLLLALALEKFDIGKIEVYTNCRDKVGKAKVVDEPLAEKVANAIGKKLKPSWMVHPLDLSEKEFATVSHNSFLLFDGQVRMHVHFFEEYNNGDFKQKVHEEYSTGLSGIGGELFRNHDGMVSKYWTKDRFIKYYIVKNFLGDCFLAKKDEESFFNKLDKKLSKILNINDDKVHHIDLKKFYNFILVPYRLGIRNNAENRLFHFYSPFIDPSTVYQGFENIEYLGSSISFEKDLICNLSQNLAQVELDYGIKPSDKVSARLRFKPYIKSLIPQKLYVKLRINKLRAPNTYEFERDMKSKFVLFQDAINHVQKLNLPINIDILLSSPDSMPIVYNLGYFLMRLDKRNYFDEL